MSPSDEHEEKKVQDTLALIRENPRIKATEATRQTRTLYHRVIRQMKGIPRSSSHRGHNKKLNEPETRALREYLLMYYTMGRGAGIENTIAAANSLLRYQGSDTIASRR